MENNQGQQGQNQGNRNPGQNLSPEARSKGGQNSPGNFKNDPERAAEAGRKGGEASGGNQGSSQGGNGGSVQ